MHEMAVTGAKHTNEPLSRSEKRGRSVRSLLWWSFLRSGRVVVCTCICEERPLHVGTYGRDARRLGGECALQFLNYAKHKMLLRSDHAQSNLKLLILAPMI